MWALLTDLGPPHRVAAIVMRFGGTAREVARSLTPEESVNGGVVNGVRLDPVAYLVRGLQIRFAPLGEEPRLTAMLEYTNFQRRSGERISELIARYELVRARALQEGNLA